MTQEASDATTGVHAPQDQPGKRPFDIDDMLRRIAGAVRPFPKAAMFALAEEGYRSPFEQLVACMLSIRTRDEVSLVAARRLFAVARTPAAIAGLSPDEIDALIPDVTFHGAKAVAIRAIVAEVLDRYGGALPCDPE